MTPYLTLSQHPYLKHPSYFFCSGILFIKCWMWNSLPWNISFSIFFWTTWLIVQLYFSCVQARMSNPMMDEIFSAENNEFSAKTTNTMIYWMKRRWKTFLFFHENNVTKLVQTIPIFRPLFSFACIRDKFSLGITNHHNH